MTETWASVCGPSNACTNFLANALVALHPDEPTLPLPSSSSTTSIFVLHSSGLTGSRMQACSLQGSLMSLAASLLRGHLPRPTAGVATALRFVLLPASHCLEQMDHSVHGAKSQSLSQACMLQETVSEVSPQGLPSYRGCTRTFRARSMTPPPHSAEQALQPLHSSSLQSTGQGCSWQLCICFRGGHALPPPVAGMMTERCSSWTPPPQVREHSVSSQSPTVQSWKNGCLAPFILNSSVRIFLRAQSSPSRPRNFALQVLRLVNIPFFSSVCSVDFIWPSSAAVFSPEVPSASFVCSSESLVVNIWISPSRVSLVSSQAASSNLISSSSSSRLSTVSVWMLRNLLARL
mmetsp:Transcript_36488/g.113747  ORF Transcript_36488/g.113747 Transcript_36488/m.113747 type:complete len:348 (+) Transcript_36488:645-1688(+)